MNLANLSDASQILLVVLATVAAAIAGHQARSSAALSIFQELQNEHIREQRRHVIQILLHKSYSDWDQADRGAAAAVAASYEMLGALLKRRMAPRKMFIQFYGSSVVKCYPALDKYISELERITIDKRRYFHFRWLHRQAMKR